MSTQMLKPSHSVYLALRNLLVVTDRGTRWKWWMAVRRIY